MLWFFGSCNLLLEESQRLIISGANDINTLQILLADCFVKKTQEIALKNAFIHLLRNSLDHGIEDPDTRRRVSAFENGSLIQLELSDDGRGFAVARMRDKALKAGAIKPNAAVNDVFEFAFQQGVSTATSLTEVSGRGVGMDAVRRFIVNEGGYVRFKPLGPVPGNADYYLFKIVITLPNLNVKKLVA